MKTACEEAADILCDDFMPTKTHAGKESPNPRDPLIKRLRSEARKIKRYESIICSDEKDINKWLARVNREKARIQKARKAK